MKYIPVVLLLLFFLGCTADGEVKQNDTAAPQPRYDYLFTGFKTDHENTNIDLGEILSGGPQKDGIPAVDNPSFVSVIEADDWIGDTEPVLLLTWKDTAPGCTLFKFSCGMKS